MPKPVLRKLLPALLLPGLLAACGGSDTSISAARRRPLYFDVKGLLDAQIQQLTARRAGATKVVSLRDGQPETTDVPTLKWANELQVFFQADINKAALRGAYTVDSTLLPGEERRYYTRRPGYDNAPVAELSVLTRQGQAEDVTAVITQDNTLFSTRKRLHLRLTQGRLVEYGVRGTQKLVLFDTLHYATRSVVR